MTRAHRVDRRIVFVVAVASVALGSAAIAAATPVSVAGGETKENATTISVGQDIRIEESGGDHGWYKIYVQNKGRVFTFAPLDRIGADYGADELFLIHKDDTEIISDGDDVRSNISLLVNSSGQIYIGVDSSRYNVGRTFTTKVENANNDPFVVDSVTTLPDRAIRPGMEVTVQSRIRYTRQNIENPQKAVVAFKMDDDVVSRKTVKVGLGSSESVQSAVNLPYDTTIGEHSFTVLVYPEWSKRGVREKSVTVNVTARDTDNDGLYDLREQDIGTDPRDPDTDGDGLSDGKELQLGSDPTEKDTDGDGVDDGTEVQQGTDPTRPNEPTTPTATVATVAQGGEQGTTANSGGATTPVSDVTTGQVLQDQGVSIENDRVNVLLKSQKTIVNEGQPAILKFSAVNLISNSAPMTLQLILETPSGVSVTGASFTESGVGQYTTTYDIEPGDTKGIQIQIEANEPGRFGVTGHVVFFFGNDKDNATSRSVTIPIEVLSGGEEQTITTASGSDSGGGQSIVTPGFGALQVAIAALLFLLVAAYRTRHR